MGPTRSDAGVSAVFHFRSICFCFYGHPYSIESRLNLLDFCKRYKLNYYGYGPKSDPYHAGNWRMDYRAIGRCCGYRTAESGVGNDFLKSVESVFRDVV